MSDQAAIAASELRERRPLLGRMTGGLLDREVLLGYVLLTPALVLLVVFMAYPLAYGIWLSLTNTALGAGPGEFTGFRNFQVLFRDPVYIRSLLNTFLYTVVSMIPKFGLGLLMAAVLNIGFRFNRFFRAAMLLPFIVPTVLSTLAWLWMFNSTYSVFNWVLLHAIGVHGPQWLGTEPWALISVMTVNVWRGIPFFGVLLVAAMQTVPQDLYDAAAMDGASAFKRWLFVTVPSIRPVIMIATLLSVVSTFGDFQIIWVLTAGGPVNSTQVLSTYAFATGIPGTEIGLGAAISLTMFPFLCILVGVVLWLLRRE